MRAISTVLDVSLCLLLVSASALTLAGTPSAGTPLASESGATLGPDTADEIAEQLAASTARVTYDAGNRTRTAHDTLAGLLASAAVADARRTARTGFVQAATTRVGRAVRRRAVRQAATQHAAVRNPAVGVQVVARRSSSTANSTTRGRVVAGDTPPPAADVHAATFEVRGVELTVRTWSK
ncbi:DUF7284 family protein [Halorussus salinisoli]|uniref:DUF7284 family protein n=1 Tax=Halorussus salinisoli TaxID=2558242 RepID=UPI0010C1DC02|nr:hypothetical protein [Halorussus salinisoli]